MGTTIICILTSIFATIMGSFFMRNAIEILHKIVLTTKTASNHDARLKATAPLLFNVGLIIICISLVVIATGYEQNRNKNPISSQSEVLEENQHLEIDDEGYVHNYRFMSGTYTGSVDLKTNLPNGDGKMQFDDMNVYSGDWIQGEINGYGTMQYANGDTYVGEWKNNKREGSGCYTWGDGKQYVGEFKNDLRNGVGTYKGWVMTLPDGEQVSGSLYVFTVNDIAEGYGRFTADDDTSIIEYVELNNGQLWEGSITQIEE